MVYVRECRVEKPFWCEMTSRGLFCFREVMKKRIGIPILLLVCTLMPLSVGEMEAYRRACVLENQMVAN